MKLIKFIIKTAVLCCILLAILYVGICGYFPLKHYDVIKKYAEEYSLDPALVCAVIRTESNFRENAESKKGARGLMQLMPDTIDWAAAKIPVKNFSYADIEKPDVNIRIGCYLLNYLNESLGNEKLAIAAYNAGIGNVNKWLSNSQYSHDGEKLHSIPYKETEEYVKKVELYKNVYTLLLRYNFYEIEKNFTSDNLSDADRLRTKLTERQ